MKNTTLVFFLTLILIVFGNFSSVHAKKTAPPKKDAVFAVMDPRGVQPPGDLVPRSVQDLSNKIVYIIRSWPDASSGLEETFGKVARAIKDRFPTATVVIKTRNTHYDLDDPLLWKEMKENKVAAFILWSSTVKLHHRLRFQIFRKAGERWHTGDSLDV